MFNAKHTLTQINTYISTQKLTKPFTKHIKIQLQGLACCSKESSPAHCTLPFVRCRTQNQRAVTCAGCGQQVCREPSTDSHPPLDAMLGATATLPSPAPWLAPLFSHLINLSAKTFDTPQYGPGVFQSMPSLSIWFQHFKITELTLEGSSSLCLNP